MVLCISLAALAYSLMGFTMVASLAEAPKAPMDAMIKQAHNWRFAILVSIGFAMASGYVLVMTRSPRVMGKS